MTEISSYSHPPDVPAWQQADTAPGPYYVSVADAGRASFLSGPYATHQEALDAVEICRTLAIRHNPWAHFYAFGTVRVKVDYNTPGLLQSWGYPLIKGGEPIPATPENLMEKPCVTTSAAKKPPVKSSRAKTRPRKRRTVAAT